MRIAQDGKGRWKTRSRVRKGWTISSQQSSTLEKQKGKCFFYSVSGNAPEAVVSTSQGLSPSLSYAMLHYKWCLGTAWLSSFVKSPYTCLYTFTYKLKTVTALLWERYEILIFCVVMAAPSNSLSFHSDIIMPDWPSPFIPKEHCCRVFWLFKSVQFNSIPHSGILRAVFPVLLLTS